MKVIDVMFEKKVSQETKSTLGKYESETLKLEGVIADNDNTDLAIFSLMDRVHLHLGIKFNSKIKEEIEKMRGAAKPVAKPTVDKPSTTEAKPEAPKKPVVEKKEEEVVVPAVEEVVAEVAEAADENIAEDMNEEDSNNCYDNSIVEHKSEFAKLLDKIVPDWRDTPENLEKAKGISKKMVGKVLYSPKGKVMKNFVNKLKAEYGIK